MQRARYRTGSCPTFKGWAEIESESEFDRRFLALGIVNSSIDRSHITVSGICLFRLVNLKKTMMNMNLFKRTRDKAIKKWHYKAWMVNPSKTKIVLVAEAAPKRKHVPPWIYRRTIQQLF
jgi:hypothetical protein